MQRDYHSYISLYGFYDNNTNNDTIKLKIKYNNNASTTTSSSTSNSIKILIPKKVILIMDINELDDMYNKINNTNEDDLTNTIIASFQETFVDMIKKTKDLINNTNNTSSSDDKDAIKVIISCIDNSIDGLLKQFYDNTSSSSSSSSSISRDNDSNQEDSIKKYLIQLNSFINNNTSSIDGTTRWRVLCCKVIINELESLYYLKKYCSLYQLALNSK